MDLDFEAARKRVDERLNQELTRIRNLPKRSKIKICNKHGLQHAHHMNTGLLKNLEIDLSVLKREKRRVVNELNKNKKTFTDTTQKSFPRLLPILAGQDVGGIKKVAPRTHRSPQRFKASWRQHQTSDYFDRQETVKAQQKRNILIAITEQSKQRTKKIIEDNIKKINYILPSKSETGNNGFLTRLNKRGELRRSCFPPLLGERMSSPVELYFRKKKHKADAYYKATTYFMSEEKKT